MRRQPAKHGRFGAARVPSADGGGDGNGRGRSQMMEAGEKARYANGRRLGGYLQYSSASREVAAPHGPPNFAVAARW